MLYGTIMLAMSLHTRTVNAVTQLIGFKIQLDSWQAGSSPRTASLLRFGLDNNQRNYFGIDELFPRVLEVGGDAISDR